MKKLRLLLTVALVATLAPVAGAQALWTSAGAKLGVTKRLNLQAEMSYRTQESFDGSERVALSVGADYRLLPWLKVAATYALQDIRTPDRVTAKGNTIPAFWQVRNRGYLALTGSYKIDRLTLSLRETYMITHRGEKYVPKFDSDGDPKPDELIKARTLNVWRTRFEAEYNIRRSPFTPYASVEMFNSLDRGCSVTQWRFTVGTEIKLNRHNELQVFYRRVEARDPGDIDINAIGIGYTYKFKLNNQK